MRSPTAGLLGHRAVPGDRGARAHRLHRLLADEAGNPCRHRSTAWQVTGRWSCALRWTSPRPGAGPAHLAAQPGSPTGSTVTRRPGWDESFDKLAGASGRCRARRAEVIPHPLQHPAPGGAEVGTSASHTGPSPNPVCHQAHPGRPPAGPRKVTTTQVWVKRISSRWGGAFQEKASISPVGRPGSGRSPSPAPQGAHRAGTGSRSAADRQVDAGTLSRKLTTRCGSTQASQASRGAAATATSCSTRRDGIPATAKVAGSITPAWYRPALSAGRRRGRGRPPARRRPRRPG